MSEEELLQRVREAAIAEGVPLDPEMIRTGLRDRFWIVAQRALRDIDTPVNSLRFRNRLKAARMKRAKGSGSSSVAIVETAKWATTEVEFAA